VCASSGETTMFGVLESRLQKNLKKFDEDKICELLGFLLHLINF
jgi:hypothetical protein